MKSLMKMNRRKMLASSLLPATLALTGCKQLGGLLPVIAEIIGSIGKAQKALQVVDATAGQFFAFHPNQDWQDKYAQAKGVADNALGGLLKVAEGAEHAANEDIDKAYDFCEVHALGAIIDAMGEAIQPFDDGVCSLDLCLDFTGQFV